MMDTVAESETATLVHDLELRLTDDVAEVVFNGTMRKAGIGPIKLVGQLVLRHGKGFRVRPI
jgi:hypothetical protein